MKYTDAVEYMESLKVCSRVPDLDSLKRLCKKLDNPQNDLIFIHIEGIAAKGEVNAFVSAVLRCAGYKVGRFPAPTVSECRERFQTGNRPITKKAFGELTEQVKAVCESIVAEGHGHPSFAEVEIAVAFLYFRQQGCQMVLLENDFMAEDHSIASSKASLQKGLVLKIAERSQVLQVPVLSVDTTAMKKVKYGLEKQRFDYKEWKGLEISLAGIQQIENAALAVEILSSLQVQGYVIPEAALRKGFKEATYPGCFSLLGKKPYFVADGADDEASVLNLTASIERYFPNRRIIFIIGMSAKSEYEKVIRLTHEYADWIITVTPPKQKAAMSSYELAAEIAKVHPQVTAVDSLEEAVEVAYLLTGKEDVIIAFGCRSICNSSVFNKNFNMINV